MVIRVEDLVESILKQREEFLSITSTEPDVVSVKSIKLYDDLVYILENIPQSLMNRISIEEDNIHITTSDIDKDDIDINVEYDYVEKSFSASISISSASCNSSLVDTMDEFVEYLIGKESGKSLQLHPYGILYSKDSLSRYDTFPSFLYPIPVSFENNNEELYLYLFKNKNKFFELFGFDAGCFQGQSLTGWVIPPRYLSISDNSNVTITKCAAKLSRTGNPCNNKAKDIIGVVPLCGLHMKEYERKHLPRLDRKPKGGIDGFKHMTERDIEDLSIEDLNEENE